jgi:MoaA/NifB/PqqE/SkfB family radical SAM enzyme
VASVLTFELEGFRLSRRINIFMNDNYRETKTIHLELSSHCNLSCPGCDRTRLIREKRLQHFSLSIDDVIKILDLNTDIQQIIFSGAISDVIYYKNLFEVLEYINTLENRPRLIFSTNGSGKTIDWWNTFGKLLKATDTVYFAVDGLEDTNKIYRVGSDWNSIINGIKSLRSSNTEVTIIWAYCVFEHNYRQVREAYNLSKVLKIGFDLKLGDNRTPKEMILTSKTLEEILVSK